MRLVEAGRVNSAVNRFWGEVNGKGNNTLGVLLMEIREELRKGVGAGSPRLQGRGTNGTQYGQERPSCRPHAENAAFVTSRYDEELQQLAVTYKTGLAADVSRVMGAITGASESSIIGVGFGGSFTIASLLCNLHESYTGRISRAATSLELICNPTLAASSPVFLISAEGKNPDIIEALRRARGQSSRTVHVLTNRADSPLIDCARELTNVNTLVFDLTEKDGYLATNSLLLDALLIARSYGELDGRGDDIPATIDALRLDGRSIDRLAG